MDREPAGGVTIGLLSYIIVGAMRSDSFFTSYLTTFPRSSAENRGAWWLSAAGYSYVAVAEPLPGEAAVFCLSCGLSAMQLMQAHYSATSGKLGAS